MVVVLPSSDAVEGLCQRLLRLRTRLVPPRRGIVLLAGTPGSGKSTVSQAVVLRLAALGICDVSMISMVNHDICQYARLPPQKLIGCQDGYHYPKTLLSTFKNPVEAFRRRGAPFTFNAMAFLETVVTISSTPVIGDENAIAFLSVPGFDHAVQDPTPGTVPIMSDAGIVIIEGNYTLLDEEPWRNIAPLADEK